MQLKSKVLREAAWKDIASRHKLKDNGLLKALGRLGQVGDDDPAAALAALAEVSRLAGQLKKDKAVAAAEAAADYVDELLGATEDAERGASKAKAQADKEAKAREKKQAAEDEEGETPEVLTRKMVALVRQAGKGETLHTVIATAGRELVVLLSRREIQPAQRKILAKQLEGGGTVKYHVGQCTLEDGAVTFALKTQVTGMAKRIKAALLAQTGLRVNKVACRGIDDRDEDADA